MTQTPQEAANSGASSAITHEREALYSRQPLNLSGALGSFQYEESTPEIGREYMDVDVVKDILEADNADELIRDLAITGNFVQCSHLVSTLLTLSLK